jgi:hypothetical protein
VFYANEDEGLPSAAAGASRRLDDSEDQSGVEQLRQRASMASAFVRGRNWMGALAAAQGARSRARVPGGFGGESEQSTHAVLVLLYGGNDSAREG